jgi:hypothetical protein
MVVQYLLMMPMITNHNTSTSILIGSVVVAVALDVASALVVAIGMTLLLLLSVFLSSLLVQLE